MKTNMNMMKSILMVLVVGALVCSSCKDGDDANGSGTQPCNCFTAFGSTAHLAIDEACKCGGTECHCTEQTDAAYNVPIRKVVNVSVKQMNDTVAIIKSAMDHELFANKEMWTAKGLTAIHIVSGNEVDFQNGILTVGYDATSENILSAIADIYDGTTPFVKYPQ